MSMDKVLKNMGISEQDFEKIGMVTTDKYKCNLGSCRYNDDGICQSLKKREECVQVSKLVLCLEE